MKVLGISGSPRARGNTARLLAEVLHGVSDAGGETSAVSLSEYTIEGCLGCERCRRDLTCTRFNDGMTLLYPRIMDADALVLGSPVYHYNVTSQMKAFIDRLYAFYDFTDDRPRGYSSRLADRERKAWCLRWASRRIPPISALPWKRSPCRFAPSGMRWLLNSRS